MIPLLTYLSDKIKNIYITSLMHSFHHAVNNNVCPTSTNTGTETKIKPREFILSQARRFPQCSLGKLLASQNK